MRYLLLLLILLAGCGQKDTNDMWQVFRQRDFTGGENLSELPEKIKNNQLIKLDNCLISPEGWITEFFQTDSEAITSTVNSTIQGVVLNKTTNGNYTVYLIKGVGTTIYTGVYNITTNAELDLDTFTPTTVTGGSVGFSGIAHAVRFVDKLYTNNGGSGGIVNLTDATIIASSLSGNILREYNNRLWLVMTDGSLRISNNGDATTWDALNVLYTPNHDPIIDFIPVQGGAIVIGKTSIYTMYGSDYTDITFVKLIDNVSNIRAVQVGNLVYIYGADSIYVATLNSIQRLELDQFSYFNTYINYNSTISSARVNGAYLPKRGLVLFYYPENSSNIGMWLNIKDNSVGKFTLANDYICPIDSKDTDFFLYYTPDVAIPNAIRRGSLPVTTRGTALQATIKTKHEDFGSTKDKIFREFAIDSHTAIPSGVTIKYYLNQNHSGTVILDDTALDAGKTSFFLNNARAKSISFEVIINTTKPFTIKELKVRLREVGQIE